MPGHWSQETRKNGLLFQEPGRWLNLSEHSFNKALLVGAKKFKVKITGIDKSQLGEIEAGHKLSDSFIERVNNASGRSLQMARLLNPGSEGQIAMIVATCSSEEEMEGLLADRYIPIGAGNVANISAFYETQKKTCKHCSSPGHLIKNCPNKHKCPRCRDVPLTTKVPQLPGKPHIVRSRLPSEDKNQHATT